MRALVLSSSVEDSSAAAIARALRACHEVVEFDYARAHTPLVGSTRWRRVSSAWRVALRASGLGETFAADRLLLRAVRGQRFDIALVTRPDIVPPEVIAELRRATGALVVGWFMDHVVGLGDAVGLASPYHRLYLKDTVVVERLRRSSGRRDIEYLAQGFDPSLHGVVERGAADVVFDVATYGNGYPFRDLVLGPLLDERDIRVAVFGRSGARTPPRLRAAMRPPVWGRDKARALRAASIALNTSHFGELGGVNRRTFELCGMGAFQLTDGPAISRYFEPGAEVAVFSGPRELVEKVRHYLDRPGEREVIARAGFARAHAAHTWAHRLDEMFATIPEIARANPPRLVPSG